MKTTAFALFVVAPLVLRAQAPAGAIPPVAEQMAAAVLPLPADMRADATVLGYKIAGRLEVLRQGKNGMRCLALYVTRPDFHVACYHESLEPFMARGREIRDKGTTSQTAVDSIRFAEIASGKLKMPQHAALYSLTAKDKKAWDPATGKVTGATPLGVVYMPFATSENVGLSANPATKGPWIMFPGTAKAHVMIVGTMQ
jgi:hypothetical protein